MSFSFNQAIIFLCKYLCLCVNKSVFNWTFCQLCYSWKNPIVQNNFWAGVSDQPAPMVRPWAILLFVII
jgi:hypothetical protein